MELASGIERFLALPSVGGRTTADWKAYKAQTTNPHSDPRLLNQWDRSIDGVRR